MNPCIRIAGPALLLVAMSACASGPATAPLAGLSPGPSSAAWPAEPIAASAEPSQLGFLFGRSIQRRPSRFRESEIYDTPFTVDTHFGIRMLEDEQRWGDLNRQSELGVSIMVPLVLDDPTEIEDTRTGFLSLISYDFGLRYAFDSSQTTVGSSVAQSLESQTFDVHVGFVASPFQYTSRFQPYIGGGLAFVFIDTDLNRGGTIQSDRDSVLTGYLRTGARVVLDYGRHVGLDVRWLNNADVEIDGLGADVGALSVSLTFGASF